jgi:hypothetical protein
VKGDRVERVFDCLKLRSKNNEFISTEEICLLTSDIEQFLSGGKGTETTAAQILAKKRHNSAKRDEYVSLIMKRINEESKRAAENCKMINHIRFIKESNVPESLAQSVAKQIRLQIKIFYNDFYKPLSRAPKKKEEPYFLIK